MVFIEFVVAFAIFAVASVAIDVVIPEDGPTKPLIASEADIERTISIW